MKKVFKWIGIVLGIVLVLGIGWYGKAYYSTEARLEQVFQVDVPAITIPSDSASIAEGKHLAAIKGCLECHGDDMGGKMMLDEPMLGRFYATNLTRGKGGLPENYSPKDWLRSIRHGVRPDGKPLLLMPSHEFHPLTERDLAAIIAYCQTLEPVDRENTPQKIGPMIRILADLDQVPLLPAEKLDHHAQMQRSVDKSVSASYGEYLSVSCGACHGKGMKGAPPMAPGMPAVPDISSTGNVGRWTQEQFTNTLRTGTTPEGRTMKNTDMPWQMTAHYSDDELESVYLYLKSL